MARSADKSEHDAWSLDSVVRKLREQSGPDGCATAHVFLDDGTGEDVGACARQLVDAAHRSVGDGKAEIGRVHKLARSFAVRATPELVAALGRQPGVKSVLPGEVQDIYPKPVDRGAG